MNALPVAVGRAQASFHVRGSSSTTSKLGCKKGAKGTITQRHDLVLPILGAPVKEAGLEWGAWIQPELRLSSSVAPAVPNQGQGRLQGEPKKLDDIAHWPADKAKSWGIDTAA